VSLKLNVERVTPAGDAGQAVVLITIAGEVDMATVPELREALLDQIDTGERGLVLDVSEVPFLDSTGLGVLMEVHRRLREVNGQVALVGARSALIRLLTITNLSRALPVYRSVSDAAAAIMGGGGAGSVGDASAGAAPAGDGDPDSRVGAHG
jgi:anti-anti-sigma factor